MGTLPVTGIFVSAQYPKNWLGALPGLLQNLAICRNFTGMLSAPRENYWEEILNNTRGFIWSGGMKLPKNKEGYGKTKISVMCLFKKSKRRITTAKFTI